MHLPRSSGVQLHVTSLPSGRLGRDAHAFVDWLGDAGQSWWQILPLGPPDRHGSPYKAGSAFAASPALVSDRRAAVKASELADFMERNAYWARDWARVTDLADQVRFEREWNALRAHADERGVQIVGDVPIYVAPGSVDHRSHPALFLDGVVAGTPPDSFAARGQLWGNPLYDWPALRRRRYRWWIERLRRTFELVDVARIDHFRGFVAYWAVPRGSRDARHGRWRRGPGRAPFDAARRALGGAPRLIAEDLGRITPPVERLRDELGLPGMVVLQLGFEPNSPHRMENHAEQRIVYTGTHDHDTIRGWYESLEPAVRSEVDAEIASRALREAQSWWSLIRLAFSSRARVAIVQAQDILGLGSDARMNRPGVVSGNWRWRLEPGQLGRADAQRLRAATEEAGRLNG